VAQPLAVDLLHQHSSKSIRWAKDFNYAKEFKTLDLGAVKRDLAAVMTDSQPWWPRISVITVLCLSGWRGTAQEHTAQVTVEAVVAAGSSALHPSIAGRIT